MFIVFDLDGTLALNEHRQHFVKRPVGEKDWTSFFDACDKDVPNVELIKVLIALERQGHHIEIWSGRTDLVIGKSKQWLKDYGLGHVPTKFRVEGDRTSDVVLKCSWMLSYRIKPDLVFDDRKSVVDMWRANGITCFQVAPGDF